MIVYLKNVEIDRPQWDSCVMASPHFKPYGLSWYLDIMSPGWEALIDDDYDAVFPIPGFRKMGISYIATPIFLQQLGVYSPDTSEVNKIHEFIDYMPQFYRFIDLNINQNIYYQGFNVSERLNLELSLFSPYESIIKSYSSDCRRNIAIVAKKNFKITTGISPKELINLFRQNKGRELKNIKERDYSKLETLMDFCLRHKKGMITGVRSPSKGLLFGIFILDNPGIMTLLFTAGTSESRDLRLGYWVIDEIIRQNAGTKKKLDFAGSSIPSISAFMESFGCSRVPYYRIYNNRLAWPLRMFK